MICIYNNKEHKSRLIDQETIVVRTYPVRWNAPNRGAVVQPREQISKLQTNRHTSSEQIQACRLTGVKNYMLTNVFFLFFFPSLFLSYSFFFFLKSNTQGYRHRGIEQNKTCCLTGTPYRHDKTTSWPPHRHKRTSTSLSPHRPNTNTQADSHTGEKLQSCRHTGVTQKSTSLLPHRQQNYKLAARQA